MTDDQWNDDEDWYDDEDDSVDASLDAQEVVPCPECGAGIEIDAEKCPECGFWILEADRRLMQSDRSVAGRLKLAAVILLVLLLSFAMLGGLMML